MTQALHTPSAPSMGKGPLAGVRVVDMTRLAPGPYCSMLLADLGAEVITVGGGRTSAPIAELSRGKRFITLDLKSDHGRQALHRLVTQADVFLEGFRPGVCDRIGAGYVELAALNPRLLYCSLTGYGQSGPRAQEAGHDINYLAVSGVLGALGPSDREPAPPLNIVADLAGGGLLAAFGIASALFERERSGKGQYLDVAMVDGCVSLMAMIFPLWKTSVMPERGKGLFGAPFYRSYRCADGRHVSVGALERPFFEALWRGVADSEPPAHFDVRNWPLIEQKLSAVFVSRDRAHWAAHFAGSNACVTPVLEPDEVHADPQLRARHGVAAAAATVPVVPRFGRTPGEAGTLDVLDQTRNVLGDAGVPVDDIERAVGSAGDPGRSGLDWPPRF